MPREMTNVPLPGSKRKLVRAHAQKGGHILYSSGDVSVCKTPGHAHCAYTGREPGRCPVCHRLDSLPSAGCPEEHGCLPPGRRPCYCTACGEIFSSNAAFDQHRQRFRCMDPERRGLIIIERSGWELWGFPGEPPPR
jgi:hypothetical protein